MNVNDGKELMECPYCKEDVIKGAIKCKHCGSDLTKPVQSDNDSTQRLRVASIISMIGGALLVIGLVMPWMTAGVFSVSAFQKVGDSYIFLIFGIVIALLAAIGMILKRNFGLIIVLCSLLCLVYMAYLYYQLLENVGTFSGGFSSQIGGGFYISAIGAFIALLGGAMMAQKPKCKK